MNKADMIEADFVKLVDKLLQDIDSIDYETHLISFQPAPEWWANMMKIRDVAQEVKDGYGY